MQTKPQELVEPRASPNFKQEIQSYDTTFEGKLPPQTELLILWTIEGAKRKDQDSYGIYGLDIQQGIESQGNESISVGTLYSLLKRLRKKGYVRSEEGESVGGGAKRRYYSLTASGEAVIEYADKFFSQLRSWAT